MADIVLITAMGFNNEIGKDNKLLCTLKDDLEYFKQITEGNVVIMGRKTYESIGKPLPNRTNIVLTKNEKYQADGCIVFHSLRHVFEWIRMAKIDRKVFIIGGEEIYNQFLPYADYLSITRIDSYFDDADAFFPQVDWDMWEHIPSEPLHYEANERNDYSFTIYKYKLSK